MSEVEGLTMCQKIEEQKDSVTKDEREWVQSRKQEAHE
jgi:hypothetical protein